MTYKNFTFLLLIAVLSLNSQAGIKEILSLEKIEKRIKEEVAELNVGFDIDLLDLDIAEGIGISSRYKYEVEPSYKAGYYSRVDSWDVKVDLSPGDIIKGELKSPLYFNITKGSEVLFLRQFKSQTKALKASPYTLKMLPIDAQHARNLKVGDFVSIPSKMSVAVGFSGQSKTDFISANANAYLIYSGDFLIHVFRMKGNKVRLRLIAQRDRATGLDVGFKMTPTIFGVSILDRQINKILDLKSSFGYKKSKGNQLIVDYIFDLSSDMGAQAYNEIMKSTYSFKDLDVFSDMLEGYKLEHSLMSIYDLADKIAKEDLGKKKKRVYRIFKGFNNYRKETTDLKLGLIFASYRREWSSMESNISYVDKLGNRKRFYYPSYTFNRNNKLDLFIFKTEERLMVSYFGLVPMDELDHGTTYTDLGYIYDRRDYSFNKVEQVGFHQKVSDMLPSYLHDQIDWKDWKEIKTRKAAVAYFQIIFKKEAFDDLKYLTEEDIRVKLFAYYKERTIREYTFVDGLLVKVWKNFSLIKGSDRADIRKIARDLYKVLHSDKIDGKGRVKILMKLRKKRIFKKIGFGFLMSLIPREKLKDLVYINLNVHAKDTSEVKFKFGTSSYSKMYNQLMYVNKVLNDRSYDLRLNEEELNFSDKEF